MSAPTGFVAITDLVEAIDATPYLTLLDERFGIPGESFDDFLVFRPNRKWLAVVNRRMVLPPGVELLAVGMPFMYDRMRDPRLTTAAAVKFGGLATRNVLDFDARQVEDFVLRRDIPIAGAPSCTGPGYVIGRHRGIIVGLGHARPDDEGLVVTGMVPRSWPARR